MSHPQIRNIPHKLTQRSKSRDTAAIEGATQRKSPQRRIKSPYPSYSDYHFIWE